VRKINLTFPIEKNEKNKYHVSNGQNMENSIRMKSEKNKSHFSNCKDSIRMKSAKNKSHFSIGNIQSPKLRAIPNL